MRPSGVASVRGRQLDCRCGNEQGTDGSQGSLLRCCLHHELALRQHEADLGIDPPKS
jgi:hypothetical protein